MKAENLQSGESKVYDGEKDVCSSVPERQKAQCGFVQSSSCSECG